MRTDKQADITAFIIIMINYFRILTRYKNKYNFFHKSRVIR